jgi:hypothetical protein
LSSPVTATLLVDGERATTGAPAVQLTGGALVGEDETEEEEEKE